MRSRGEADKRLPGDRPGQLLTSSRCPGCGLELSATGGPTHAYIGASPECWALFGELLAEGASSIDVDVYAAQHPGEPGAQAEQSVAVHLAVLCLVLEHGFDAERAGRERGPLTERPRPFGWLEPPSPLGSVTVQDVLDAACGEERDARVRDWALDVWRAWKPHQETIRAWLD